MHLLQQMNLSMADSDSDGELTPEEFFAFLEMDEGCCLPDEMKSDINAIMNNSDSDSSGTLSESELETFIDGLRILPRFHGRRRG